MRVIVINKKMYALGRLKKGEMNKTEEKYSNHLSELKCAGVIKWFTFEGMTFKLADNTRYTPDFNVMMDDGTMEMHEVKGYWMDDAKVKIKVAAEKFPFVFKAIKAVPKNKGGGWEETEF